MAKLGVAQVGSVLLEVPAMLERMEEMVDRARSKRVEVFVVPAAFIGGYPKGADVGGAVGARGDQ